MIPAHMAVYPPSPSVLVNGEPSRTVDIADRGLQYGDGIFTTLKVLRGVPLFLGRHIDRLRRDGQRLGLPLPPSEILAEEVTRLADSHPDSVIKILLTRGEGGRGYRVAATLTGTRIISAHPLPAYPDSHTQQGVRVRFCQLQLGINPALAGIKHLNRLEQVLARSEWEDDAIWEGLLTDSEGYLVEAVMSNVFLVQQGRLRTPLLDRNGVAGVMRSIVLDQAQALGMSVEICRLKPADALQADEIFLTNSVIGIFPVQSVEQRQFESKVVADMLKAQITAMILNELGEA